MLKEYAPILSILLWCIIIVDKSETENAASASASASAVATGYLDHEPVQQNPVVDSLAYSISVELLQSQVLGNFSKFELYKPYDLFFVVGSNLLAIADIYDPALAKIAADAGEDVGLVSSELYFDTIGFMLAKFLFAKGIATLDQVEYLYLSIVTSIEVVACVDGLIDTQSVMDSVVYGFFYVLHSFGLTDYDSMAELFYLFAEQIEKLSGTVSK